MLAPAASRVAGVEGSIVVTLDLQTPGARLVDDDTDHTPGYPLEGLSVSGDIKSFANQTEKFEATGSAFVIPTPFLIMGTKATAYGEASNPNSIFSPTASADARAFFSAVIEYPGPEATQVFKFSFTASVTPSTPYSHAGAGFSSFDVFGVGVGRSTPGTLVQTLPVINGKITLDLRLTALAGSSVGYAEADASHTVRLISITNPDGSTPESHGFSLTFDSGTLSPNLASVPEAASLLTWIMLGAAAVTRLARRRVS
jgi:hypothetical protein